MERFYCWLANHLGMTVSELLGSMTDKELAEWQAYWSTYGD